MLANEGFFELKADNFDELIQAVSQHQSVDKIEVQDGKALVYLKATLEARELNEYLFNKNIVLTHLLKRKTSLEEQFLKLTN
jgi:ABC-2 type transport system ATP-binding protein